MLFGNDKITQAGQSQKKNCGILGSGYRMRSCPYITSRKICVFFVCKYAARALSEMSAIVPLFFTARLH